MGNNILNIVITIASTLLVFGVLILVHELGHFTFAKLFKVKVNEFSLGMGPLLFKRQKSETQYSLRALPIGGYVSMEGEDDESDDDNAFFRKPAWQRFIITVAGASFNLIFGLLLFVMIVLYQPDTFSTKIDFFASDAVSDRWLKEGDEILEINGAKVNTEYDLTFELIKTGNTPVTIKLIRNDQEMTIEGVRFIEEQDEQLGGIFRIDFRPTVVEKTLFSVLSGAFYKSVSVVKLVWYSLISLVTGQIPVSSVAGPIGSAGYIGDAVKSGFDQALFVIALISINLGVFNLLPIPALDGGRLLFLLIEMIFRKPVPRKFEAYVHAAGMVLVLALAAVIALKDIWQIFT